MKRIVSVLLFSIYFGDPWGACAQQEPTASVEVEVDRSEITIGDQIEYRMNISYDPGIEIQKPGWGEGLENFQILDFKRGNPEKVENHWETTDVYTLSTFTPEDYIIPPVQIPIKLPTGATQVLETQPITIKVASVLPDDDTTLELRDIHDPVPVYSGISWNRIAWVVGALIVLGIIAFLVWRSRRSRFEPIAIPPPRPEHEIAFERLRLLRKHVEGWGPTPDATECKSFGLELSEALREYLERRLGVLALEMTTEEIEEVFHQFPFGGQTGEVSHEDQLLEIFRHTDLLKFAKGTESKERLLGWIFSAERQIEATKRISEIKLIAPEDIPEAA